MAMITAAATLLSCRTRASSPHTAKIEAKPFNFRITVEKSDYQIEGFLALASEPGRLPALLILNGDKGNAHQCIDRNRKFTTMGLQVACISLPGYGHSSGPSRFVGPPSVAAARRALDLLDERPDVDRERLAVWGLGNGAVAAGLLMDSDARPRAVILQSGAYDMLKLWPEAPLGTKLSILRQVWPSKRVLKERSVIGNMPHRLDVDVLILHGERDRKMPVDQAARLAKVLGQRGARVKTCYFPKGSHELGKVVDAPLRAFLRDNLLAAQPRGGSNPSG
ncbi:MAG: alpha/beta hydrolase family protein [Candidatus Binataceae bacterium]